MSGNNASEEHIWRRAKYGATEPRNDGSEGAFRRSIVPDAIIILGPTGSGKTGVSIKIAKDINGEIISADSRAIYKGMDIGTAKPTPEEQASIPHHGLDLVEPGDRFTVSDWKEYAKGKIKDIKARGKVPIIVGGTGLYIDALIYDYHFKGPTGEKIGDYKHETRSDRNKLKGNYLLIGVKNDSSVLRTRLSQRIDKMFSQPLFAETKKLVNTYGWNNQAMKSNIYEFVWRYLNDEISLTEAKRLAFLKDWHLAKRQITWFKRNPDIIWLELEKIYSYVLKYIQDE